MKTSLCVGVERQTLATLIDKEACSPRVEFDRVTAVVEGACWIPLAVSTRCNREPCDTQYLVCECVRDEDKLHGLLRMPLHAVERQLLALDRRHEPATLFVVVHRQHVEHRVQLRVVCSPLFVSGHIVCHWMWTCASTNWSDAQASCLPRGCCTSRSAWSRCPGCSRAST